MRMLLFSVASHIHTYIHINVLLVYFQLYEGIYVVGRQLAADQAPVFHLYLLEIDRRGHSTVECVVLSMSWTGAKDCFPFVHIGFKSQHLWKANIFVFVEWGGVAALEDVVDCQRGTAAVVDAPSVTHCLSENVSPKRDNSTLKFQTGPRQAWSLTPEALGGIKNPYCVGRVLIERLELDIVLDCISADQVQFAQMPHCTSARYSKRGLVGKDHPGGGTEVVNVEGGGDLGLLGYRCQFGFPYTVASLVAL